MVNPSIEVNLAQVSRPGDLQSHQDASRRLAEQGVDVVLAQRILDPGLDVYKRQSLGNASSTLPFLPASLPER